MTHALKRPLMDTPIPGKLVLTTDEGKMYNFYVLHPDGTKDVLDDPEIFDNWFDHCIKPSAFVELAKDKGAIITEKTLQFIHREFLDNYLNTDSILNVCIDDVNVRVLPSDNGKIDVYSYTLGIDRQFGSIAELNDFLSEKGSPKYYDFTPENNGLSSEYTPFDISQSKAMIKAWAKKVDTDRISIVILRKPYFGDLEFLAEITVSLSDIDCMKLLAKYNNETGYVNTNLASLILHDIESDENHKRYVLTGNFLTKIEQEKALKVKWGIVD